MSNSSNKVRVFKLMIGLFVGLLIVGYAWTRNGKPAANANDIATIEKGDKKQVKNRLVQLYKWKDTQLGEGDFVPLYDDGDSRKYIGLDMAKHSLRLDVLKKSGFFSDDFLSSYDNIAKGADSKLRNGELEWLVGDIPPFGIDADAWCSCQDYPVAEPWDSIYITIDSIDDKSASLAWTWDEKNTGFSYKVKLKKINGEWKISYLQGFDATNFLSDSN